MDAAKIIVDGQERSITDKEGYYKLDQVRSCFPSLVAAFYVVALLSPTIRFLIDYFLLRITLRVV